MTEEHSCCADTTGARSNSSWWRACCPPFLLFAGTAVIRTGPADYHWFPVPANITIGFWALLVLPAFANQRHDPAPTSTY
ncbi:hypothetical protein [Actinoplanes rectilineatus]|uniref:hypothetical protein n=1 Tax=Actinoplanes rectilineatus TaxID=113571 RepID=UPI0005F2B52B|nr:hypothetical protein [Actinoplanes rectilineatus]